MVQPRPSPMSFPDDKAADLAHKLQYAVEGEVRFDKGSRALYATDGSLYRQVPIGVVLPRTIDDVKTTLALCREAGAPVLSRGAGTSLAGQSCNVAVIIDFSKYLNRILEVDPKRQRARVQPGVILDHLRAEAEKYTLTFGPDPATHSQNCLGGMLGNNSCGVHSVMAGRTADNVHAMKVLTYDGVELTVGPTSEKELDAIIAEGGRKGEIYNGLKKIRERYANLIREGYPKIPRRVSGYNLDELLPETEFNVARALVGSEGTCVAILEAELELVYSPPNRCLLVLGYPDVYTTGDHVTEIRSFNPVGLEGMDHLLFEEMSAKDMHAQGRALLPEGRSWLLVEFGGETKQEARQQAQTAMDKIRDGKEAPYMTLVDDPEDMEKIWATRESGLAATSRSPRFGEAYPGWEDSAVPPENVGTYLRDFRELMHKHDYEAALYGHFGDGCIHCRINFDVSNEAGVAKWKTFMREAADLVTHHGGAFSGEHGDGQVRAELLDLMYGKELVDVFREFKSLWDPQGKMNPGKVIDPYPMTANLRAGPDTHLPALETIFAFPEDNYSFARAADRCVGIGKCRKKSGGVMCPSYRATMEEKHSTRGRARLLFEMLKGEELDESWRSDAVEDALDLCLACKGCKTDCPVNVDMATLKAEFMSHYYKGKLRPRTAYSLGLIWWWSRIATRMPKVVNFILQTPVLARIAKQLAGITPQREMPRYATQNFRDWFTRRGPMNKKFPRVVLWPDTFNNYFYPETLKAAVRVLEAAGYEVVLPPRPLCCSRPLYAEGMLDLARHQLRGILDALHADIMQGNPLVGLEPSCIASFRDELPRLFPGNERAHYLAQHSYLLTEFLEKVGYQPPQLQRRALVQIHCHHYASLSVGADANMLKKMKIDAEVLDAGCCGMAGSFGFDAKKYHLSQRIAEHQLLPAIRKADDDILVITNGFSCKEQISQATGRSTLHMAEILDLALQTTKEAEA